MISDCQRNLETLGQALVKYRQDHDHQMPHWLSDLYPQYLADEKLLICPADPMTGQLKHMGNVDLNDPNLACSYFYYFNPQPVGLNQIAKFIKFDPQKEYSWQQVYREFYLPLFKHLTITTDCPHHETYYRLAITYDGKVIHYSTGWSYNWGTTAEADSVFVNSVQRLIRDQPENWNNLIDVEQLYKRFKSQAQLTELRLALEAIYTPSNEVLAVLADIYQDLSQIDQAISCYQQLERLNAINIETRLKLAKLYFKQERVSKFDQQIKTILELEPNNIPALQRKAEMQAFLDLSQLQQRLESQPDSDRISVVHTYALKQQEMMLDFLPGLLKAVASSQQLISQSAGNPRSKARMSSLYQSLNQKFNQADGIWRHYTPADGLMSDFVLAIVQDQLGQIWLGTTAGLCYFNGSEFKPFQPINEKISSQTYITSLFIDSDGHLWVGTRDRGLFQYDGQKVVHYTTSTQPRLVSDNQITNIVQTADGSIWWTDQHGGISRFNKKSAPIKNFSDKDGLLSNSVLTLEVDQPGNLWIGTRDGLSYYDGKDFTSYTGKDDLKISNLKSIASANNGQLWLGTQDGVILYDRNHDSWTKFNQKTADKEGSIAKGIRHFIRPGTYHWKFGAVLRPQIIG